MDCVTAQLNTGNGTADTIVATIDSPMHSFDPSLCIASSLNTPAYCEPKLLERCRPYDRSQHQNKEPEQCNQPHHSSCRDSNRHCSHSPGLVAHGSNREPLE